MLRKIKVYGTLKKFLDWETGTFIADISNVAEVGRFLIANWPSVEKHMQDQHYKVFVGNYNISEEELNYPIGQTEEIRIVPVAIGARGAARSVGRFLGSTVGKVVAGAALIAAPILAPTFFATKIIGTTLGAISTGVGVSLALGGVSQMLSPTPTIPVIGSSFSGANDPAGLAALDPQSNYSFSGVQNVSRAGVPVNLIFGEIFTGSVIVSAGVDTAQIKGTA